MESKRKVIIGGNWKCNGTKKAVQDLVQGLNLGQYPAGLEVVVSPPFIYLDYVLSHIVAPFQVAAQNCSLTGNGAYTGEVSADMIKDMGLNWVIIGHSERRQYYGEHDELVGDKTKVALAKGLNVIACIGEKLEERQAGKTLEVCCRQMKAIGDKIAPADWSRVVIAYEPVWAIGTGVVATPAQAQEAHAGIRAFVKKTYGDDIGNKVRIQYGGSVGPKNCQELIQLPDVDGFLVGGASLKPADFIAILQSQK